MNAFKTSLKIKKKKKKKKERKEKKWKSYLVTNLLTPILDL